MKTFGDLNLKKVRTMADLDFAHFTYKPGQCSCCYGPTDLPKLYWKDEETLKKAKETEKELKTDYTFILFKNANNGSGSVTKKDEIDFTQYIDYKVKDEKQLKIVVDELQRQLGSEYEVIMPETTLDCIRIDYKQENN